MAARFTDLGPGDEATWQPYSGHPNDPRAPEPEEDDEYRDDDELISIPADEYHSLPHVSKSQLDLIAKAPAKLRAYLDGDKPSPTPAMLLGTAFHAAVLEPEKLVCAPAFDRRTKLGKEAAAEFESEHAGRDVVIVDPSVHATATAMRASVLAHQVARRMLDDGLAERSLFSELQGVPVKCRPDFYRPISNLFVDLKSTDDASPDGFARSCAKYRYHVQAAFYMDVAEAAYIDVRSFVFVACEKAPPYLCACYVLDASDVERGRDAYQRDLATYARCQSENNWPGYSEFIEVISLPAWSRKPQEPS